MGALHARTPELGEDERVALARDLAGLATGEVRFDAGSRALYATDASNYRQVPIGVIACGERVLLPAVRSADEDTIIIADGFSCSEQIRQSADRHALHISEVLRMALQSGSGTPA